MNRPEPSAAPPHAVDSPAALDVVFIEGLRGETVIGIDAAELHRPQPLVIDVHAGVPRSRACRSDRVGDTIDYARMRERILQLLRAHRVQMLEAFAQTIADLLLDEFGAAWVRVKVVKPHKFDDVDAVGVVIERHIEDRHGSARTQGAGVLRWPRSGAGPRAD